jgi:hypothetical protein
MPTIAVSKFAAIRHTEAGPFSHFNRSWDYLIDLVKHNFDKAEPGFTDGVLLVPLDPKGFFTPVCKLEPGHELVGSYESRRDGEEPRLSMGVAAGEKMPAVACKIVLFSREVLEAGGDPATGADYDIISVNAQATESEPIHFLTLMHNHFGSDGGTDTKMTPLDFEVAMRESFDFWKNHALMV